MIRKIVLLRVKEGKDIEKVRKGMEKIEKIKY